MERRVTDRRIYFLSLLIGASWVAAAVLLALVKAGLAVRLLIGLVPVALLVVQIVTCLRYTRQQDEVQRHIILEGLAIAFAVALPAIFLVGFIEKAGVSLPFGLMEAGYSMEMALVVGYAIAWKRYQ